VGRDAVCVGGASAILRHHVCTCVSSRGITSQKISVTWNVASERRLREKLLCCKYMHCYVSCELGGPEQLQLDYEFLLIVCLKIYKWVERYYNLPLHPCNSGADCYDRTAMRQWQRSVTQTGSICEKQVARSTSVGILKRSREPPQNSRSPKGCYEASSVLRHTSIGPTIQKSVIRVSWHWGVRKSPAYMVQKKLLKISKLLSCLITNVV
jgi:hypothetical protein